MNIKILIPLFLLAFNIASAQKNDENKKEEKYTMYKEWQDGASKTYGAIGVSLFFSNPSLLNEYFNQYSNNRTWLTKNPKVNSLIPEFNLALGEAFSNRTKIEFCVYYRQFKTESEGISPLTNLTSSRDFTMVNRGIQLHILNNPKTFGKGLNIGLGLDYKQSLINSNFNHTLGTGEDLVLSEWTINLLPEIRWCPPAVNNYLDFFFTANIPLEQSDIQDFKLKFGLEDTKEKYLDWGISAGMKITLY